MSPLDKGEGVENLAEAQFVGSRCIENALHPADPTVQLTKVSAGASGVSCTPISNDVVEFVPLLGDVTLKTLHTAPRSEAPIPGPPSLMEPYTSEEALLGQVVAEETVFIDGTLDDTLPCQQLKDAAVIDPEEVAKASPAMENQDEAPPPSPSTSTVAPRAPNADETPERKGNATDAWHKGIDSSDEKFDHRRLRGRNPPPPYHRRSTEVEGLKDPPSTTVLLTPNPLPRLATSGEERHAHLLAHRDRSPTWQECLKMRRPSGQRSGRDFNPSLIHEDEMSRPNPIGFEDDPGATEVFPDGVGLPQESEAPLKDHDDFGVEGNELVTNDPLTSEEMSAFDGQASARLSGKAQLVQEAPNHPNLTGPVHTIRPGIRFSDETNMLREFLSRAQAQKAARDLACHAQTPIPTTSPQSPRKSLAEITNRSPSSRKTRKIVTRPGTPPGKAILEMGESDQLDEAPHEISCRRSTRTRLFTPARPAPGAPSLIPVRRVDGGDNIVLQRSQAQELATITRTNTRRNRGASKRPKLALQNLAAEAPPMDIDAARGEGRGKSVGWDETLVYYQAASAIGSGAGNEVRRSRSRSRSRKVVAAPGDDLDGTLPSRMEKNKAMSPNGSSRLTRGARRKEQGIAWA